jgi:hypothetical protein
MSLAGLSTGIRPIYDGVQPLQSLERRESGSKSSRRVRDPGAARVGAGQHPCQSAPLRGRRKKREASEHAIGVTKGGRNSKLHSLVDKLCQPWVIILTPGNVVDCTVGPECVSLMSGIEKLLGDKAYYSIHSANHSGKTVSHP